MLDPLAVLTSIQGAISITKAMFAGLKAVKETNQALSALDLQTQVVEISQELLNAKEVIICLMQQNQDLRAQLKVTSELEHDQASNVLWSVEDGKKRIPYCSTCHGAEAKLIPLSESEPDSWFCPKCRNHFCTKRCRDERHLKMQSLM